MKCSATTSPAQRSHLMGYNFFSSLGLFPSSRSMAYISLGYPGKVLSCACRTAVSNSSF